MIKNIVLSAETELAEHWIENRRLGRFLAVVHSATANAVEAIKGGEALPAVYGCLVDRLQSEKEYALLENELVDSVKADEFAAILTKMVRHELLGTYSGCSQGHSSVLPS